MNSYYKALCCQLPTTKLNSVVSFQEVGDLALFLLRNFPTLPASCLKASKIKKDRLFSNRNTLTTQKGLDVFAARELYRGVKCQIHLAYNLERQFAAKYRQSSLVFVACAFLKRTDKKRCCFPSNLIHVNTISKCTYQKNH